MNEPSDIRPFTTDDDIEALTRLLNRAYSKMLDRGFTYLAATQDAAMTKERLATGKCFVAERDGEICGTILYYPPEMIHGHEWYDQPFVAGCGQFAVAPELQRSGIGSRLMSYVEELAIAGNAREMTVDTAETAHDLVDFYTKRGYRPVGHAQWSTANYRSILLSKKLVPQE